MTRTRLLRTIRFDATDEFVFELAAGPDEWAVSGAFAVSASPESAKPKKLKPLSIRLTETERRHLREMAGSDSLSGYVRSVLFDDHLTDRQRKRKPTKDRATLAQILGLLGKSEIAASMRSLASAAEAGALPVTDDLVQSLRDACDEIRLIRRSLIEALGIKVED